MFTVTSTNVEWRIEEDIAWVTPDQTSGIASATVVLTYEENTTANARDGTLTFRSSDSGTPITVMINISQGGRTSRVLSIDMNKVNLPSTMGSRLIAVNTNIAWLIEENILLGLRPIKLLARLLRRYVLLMANEGASVRTGVVTFE